MCTLNELVLVPTLLLSINMSILTILSESRGSLDRGMWSLVDRSFRIEYIASSQGGGPVLRLGLVVAKLEHMRAGI